MFGVPVTSIGTTNNLVNQPAVRSRRGHLSQTRPGRRSSQRLTVSENCISVPIHLN